MRIFMSCRGQFYDGFNSKLQGEGRWLIHMAGVLATAGHQVTVFSHGIIRPYTDNKVNFESILDVVSGRECDVLVAMDPFEDMPHLDCNDITPLLNKFKYRIRVSALFFPTTPEVYNFIPVIHPWNYPEIKEGMGYYLPVITHREVLPPAFDKKYFHWYSKRANDNPQYLVGVLRGLRSLILSGDASGGLFVDGVWISDGQYTDDCSPEKDRESRRIFSQIMTGSTSESLNSWAPYDYIWNSIQRSKLLVGVHHPIAAPSMSEMSSCGGMPIIFENQKTYPPFNDVDLPVIPLSASDEEIQEFIIKAWTDRDFFTRAVLECQEATVNHAQDKATRLIINFFEEL